MNHHWKPSSTRYSTVSKRIVPVFKCTKCGQEVINKNIRGLIHCTGATEEEHYAKDH